MFSKYSCVWIYKFTRYCVCSVSKHAMTTLSLSQANTLYRCIARHPCFITSACHIDVLALLRLVAHLNGQVGWVSLHLLSLSLLLPCWWPFPFWTCFDTVPFPCMGGGSSPATQEGLGQLRSAAQLTASQLSSAPLQSLVHHCMHHYTDCVTVGRLGYTDSYSHMNMIRKGHQWHVSHCFQFAAWVTEWSLQ